MLTLNFVFWMLVVLFALIGAMRGWAKELLVSFGVILALFVITVFERFIPLVRDTMLGEQRFWVRVAIMLALVFFAYQTPRLPHLTDSPRFVRDRLQDMLLGLFLGALNGFLVFGSIWFYLNEANYPFPSISAPLAGSELGDAALKLIPMLPPQWMAPPVIYFAVALAFVFVLVVFI